MFKILLLEDDLLFLDTLEDILLEQGFLVDLATNSSQALALNYEKNYDLYIFDINLQEQNGVDLLKDLRANNDTTPTIFISSYKDKEIIKSAYLSGADDYIKKPVDLDELILKINAVLRRCNKSFENIKIKDIVINPVEKRVYKDDLDLDIPQKVVELLLLFLENKDKIVTKEQIIQKLWSASQNYSEGSIRVYVNRIKNLLNCKDCIKNIKSVGYKFEL